MLSELKDITVPVRPDFWPPAVGWWVVGLLILLGIIGAVVVVGRLWYMRPKAYALRELKKIYSASDNPVLFAKQVSNLLKRVALYCYPRQKIAALSDKKWSSFLSKKAKIPADSANFIALSVYFADNKSSDQSIDNLYSVVQSGIKSLFERK